MIRRLSVISSGLTAVLMLFIAASVQAEVLTLEQAIERAMHHDARISEKEKLVAAAQALLQEAQDSDGVIFDVNAFTGLTTQVEDGFFKPGTTIPRSGRYSWDGVTTWSSLQFTIVKPLYTFGKIEHYADAARANVTIKDQDVRLQRANTVFDVSRAYYGYLAARDTRYLFEDVVKRLDKAIALVRGWLEKGVGDVRQSDLYALQAGINLIGNYLSQAEGVEAIALAGLRMLVGVEDGVPLELADKHIEPLSVPEKSLAELQQLALKQRPEMTQLKSGLEARRSLVEAKKSEKLPNIYAGLAGMAAYSPGRERLDNPYIYDPFNDYGATPLIGVQWHWASGAQPAQVAQAQAELDALVEKSSFARNGIPFEVAEQYHYVQSYAEAVSKLKQASYAARRWMISSYADFEAGIETAENTLTAFQGYVLTYSDYLKTVNDHNMHIIRLRNVTGDIQ